MKKENQTIKDKIIRDIKTFFEEENDYHKPMKVDNFWNNNFIKYESNSDKNKNLSVKEYLNESKSYLKDVITDLQKSSTWKIQLTIAVNFISSEDNDEEQVMHSRSDNIEVLPYDNVNEVIKEIFELLFSRY